jgi:hypothetical protein
MPIDRHLLNKIRSVKALRDKGATDGERDAAQQRLIVLLAKHKLTEQDIPPDSFSTRARHSSQRSPRPSNRQRSQSRAWSPDWDAAFEETLRRFREAAKAQGSGVRFEDHPHTPPPHRTEHGVKKKPPGQVRFENAFGRPISTQAWKIVKHAQTAAQKKDHPHNANAYSRAFYEEAAFELRGRLNGPWLYPKPKSTNPQGKAAGQHFGQSTSLDVFTNAS